MSIRWTLPSHVSLHSVHERMAAVKAIVKSAFDYPTTLVGTAGQTTVYYDQALGANGLANAQFLLVRVDAAYQVCQGYFGIPGLPVNLIVAPLSGSNDGSGGAYHWSCDFSSGGDLYVDSAYSDPMMDVGLFVAELSECFMGPQGKFLDCGKSNGEAFSRFHAALASGGPNGSLAAFLTAPTWDQAGRPDFITATASSDQNDSATGCGILYLWWMVSKGFTPAQLTQAGGATFAANYKTLTGKGTALPDFMGAVAGLAGGVTSDDPWPRLPLLGTVHLTAEPLGVTSRPTVITVTPVGGTPSLTTIDLINPASTFPCHSGDTVVASARNVNAMGPSPASDTVTVLAKGP